MTTELEKIGYELDRGRREIDTNIKSLDGWADRIMASILKPLKNNLGKYPLGKNIPGKYGLINQSDWNI